MVAPLVGAWIEIFYTMGIRAEMARVVDDYFTRFGYKVLRYKVPETKSRTSFNYVQTQDAYITGSIPNEALVQIANAFNSGITLWHTTDVGNYTLDNSIVSDRGDKNEKEKNAI